MIPTEYVSIRNETLEKSWELIQHERGETPLNFFLSTDVLGSIKLGDWLVDFDSKRFRSESWGASLTRGRHCEGGSFSEQ